MSLQRRIEPREICQFVRNGAWAAADQLGQLDHTWILHADCAERDLAIQIERENVLVTGPVLIWTLGHHVANVICGKKLGERSIDADILQRPIVKSRKASE
jgi:hypothetical protein